MKRKTVIAIVAVLAVLIVLSASQLQAQGTLTLEGLAERFQLLTSDQDQLKKRLAALETAVASANVLAGIPIQEEETLHPLQFRRVRIPTDDRTNRNHYDVSQQVTFRALDARVFQCLEMFSQRSCLEVRHEFPPSFRLMNSLSYQTVLKRSHNHFLTPI